MQRPIITGQAAKAWRAPKTSEAKAARRALRRLERVTGHKPSSPACGGGAEPPRPREARREDKLREAEGESARRVAPPSVSPLRGDPPPPQAGEETRTQRLSSPACGGGAE